MDLESEHPFVLDDGAYHTLIPVLNGVTTAMKQKMAPLGVEVLRSHHWYQTGYGDHHFCGTLNMRDSARSVPYNRGTGGKAGAAVRCAG